MYSAKLDLPIETIRAQREAAKKAPAKMSDYMTQVVKPELETLVQNTLAIYPGDVVHPFEFATAKSRRWYFANMVPSGSERGKYRRTDALKLAWRVIIDRRRTDGLITIRNIHPAANYIIGEFQVPGHRVTGWAKNQEAQLQDVTNSGITLIAQGWYYIMGGN